MAFGFLIERFDLFLQLAAPSLARQKLSPLGQKFANLAGLAFIVLGTVMIAISAARLFVTARKIDATVDPAGAGTELDIALAVLLALLGGSLFLYLSPAVIASV